MQETTLKCGLQTIFCQPDVQPEWKDAHRKELLPDLRVACVMD